MSQRTSIEWTDVSWNPVHGCSKVSPGCAHCYAETLSLRYRHTTKPWTPANAAENVILKPHKLHEPLSKAAPWDRPRRVFVNSMSDLFHELVPEDFIRQVFDVMYRCPQHTFQVLTKRPERMRDVMRAILEPSGMGPEFAPLENVWLGTSIENHRFVGRADVLREVPAAVRFISAEPLLGPLARERVTTICDCAQGEPPEHEICLECGEDTPECDCPPQLDLTGIDWLIVGGESGPGHRLMRLDWVRDLRDVCKHEGVAFFLKQTGGARPGGALEDLPEDLRIREFPEPSAVSRRAR